MSPEEQPAPSGTGKPQHRSSSSRRRRGLRPQRRPRSESATQASAAQSPPESATEPSDAPFESRGPESSSVEPLEAAPASEPARDSRAMPQHFTRTDATPAIREATEQIQRINKDLQLLLLEMEKAVETLEEAEVQKSADEHEIESLRAAIRQLNRTRDNIPRQQQSHSG